MSKGQASVEKSVSAVLTTFKWASLLMCGLMLYGIYAFSQAQRVVHSERARVERVFVTHAAWLDRVAISIGGQQFFLIWEFPLSVGTELIVEIRGSGEIYVCQTTRDRCSRIRRL